MNAIKHFVLHDLAPLIVGATIGLILVAGWS